MKTGKENQIEELKSGHESYLQKIIDYVEFLLKDRLLKSKTEPEGEKEGKPNDMKTDA